MLYSKIRHLSWLTCHLENDWLVVSVFTVKFLANGSIDRYKACLIAKEFIQVLSKEFGATFVLVAKLTMVCLIVFLDASYSWSLDVKNALLNNHLTETIYMEPPS